MAPYALPGRGLVLVLVLSLLGTGNAKWVEGHIDTKERWAFLSRFCFLSLEGQFEYLIEFDKDMGTPNLLLYYDDDSQWPAVYHSSKTCKQREAVLNKAGQNQVIKLSHWYPDTEFSGCVITKENKELPASKSTTTVQPLPRVPVPPSNYNDTGETPMPSPEPSYYDQFLKTTTVKPKSTIVDTNSTTWYEVVPTDEFETTTSEDELWESVGGNGSHFENLKDVELMFSSKDSSARKIKRSTFELYERLKRRRLHNGETNAAYGNTNAAGNTRERLVVSCHNSRRFRSARERWWFIAISNCDSTKGLDVRYKFLMTNGPDGDFWHEHFSADEFYVLPVLLAYTLAYVVVMVAVVMCSVELKSRQLLHSTYKLFLFSIVVQHCGLTLQALAYVRFAVNGYGGGAAKVFGQFLSGISEMSFLLVLVLMAKGYSITRARLKLSFSVRLTIFMCIYCSLYLALLFYQVKAFDPGEVLYLYESPPGYALLVLRVCAWTVFAYATFFTVRKFPQKSMFYCPFFICGTLWFYAGPLFILTANSYIDKWVRESVVTAVLLFISFCGHIMFLLLTLPVFANKNFPYHVRTTQIGVMEVAGSGGLDNFGHNAYQPGAGGAGQTVIIPLTRRTEELIGNMYSQYMAPTPLLALDENRLPIPNVLQQPNLNNIPKRIESVSPKNRLEQQDSTDTNTSEDIKPTCKNETDDEIKDVFTIEGQMDKINSEFVSKLSPETSLSLVNGAPSPPEVASPTGSFKDPSRALPLLRSRRTVLDPISPGDLPQWSLARGPSVVAMMKKRTLEDDDQDSPSHSNGSLANGKKVPAVRNGLPSSGEISTIHEGRVPTFSNTVSKATIDLFSVGSRS